MFSGELLRATIVKTPSRTFSSARSKSGEPKK